MSGTGQPKTGGRKPGSLNKPPAAREVPRAAAAGPAGGVIPHRARARARGSAKDAVADCAFHDRAGLDSDRAKRDKPPEKAKNADADTDKPNIVIPPVAAGGPAGPALSGPAPRVRPRAASADTGDSSRIAGKAGFPKYRTVPTDALVPYANNARTHSPAQIAKIAASIREFGFTNAVLTDGKRGIIAGHGRVLAAQLLGMDTVPVIELSHLSAAQRRAYVIADNRLALDAGWDDELLALELDELRDDGFDLGLTGFDAGELDALLGETPAPESSTTEIDSNQYALDTKCPKCGFEFDAPE